MPFDLFDPTTLHKIRTKAEALLRSSEATTNHDAYNRALVFVVMQAAEKEAMTPFEARIVQTIEQLQKEQDHRPVPTLMISVALATHQDPMNRFTLAHHLRKLEDRGILCRPKGPKSGWSKAA